jgi:nuclear transcription Y subunit beta
MRYHPIRTDPTRLGRSGIEIVREQDTLLPIANVTRIMKRPLPAYAKVARDAKKTVQECAAEFIGFVTSEYAL